MISIEFVNNDEFIISGQIAPRGGRYMYVIKEQGKRDFSFISYSGPDLDNDFLYMRGTMWIADFYKLNLKYTNLSKERLLRCIDKLNSGQYLLQEK